MTNSGTGVADARAAWHRSPAIASAPVVNRELSSSSKGRRLAFATVVVVAIAWSVMASTGEIRGGDWANSFPIDLFLVTGFYVGAPIGVVAGTAIGRLAGRRAIRRWEIHVAAIACTLVVDIAPVLVVRACGSRHWLESALAMVIASLAIVVPASIVLERWTRPRDGVPLARVI